MGIESPAQDVVAGPEHERVLGQLVTDDHDGSGDDAGSQRPHEGVASLRDLLGPPDEGHEHPGEQARHEPDQGRGMVATSTNSSVGSAKEETASAGIRRRRSPDGVGVEGAADGWA